MSVTAAAQLQPSRLSNQLETFNADVDVAALNLGAAGKASFPLLERITEAAITRTIEGASTVAITANDYDRKLLDSGFIGPVSPDPRKGFDIELDGLWFRLWLWSKDGDSLKLTFIDREIAVLKQWPPIGDPSTWLRIVDATAAGTLTRFKFAERLIRDVQHILPIRFRCPPLDGSPPPTDPVDTGDPTAKGHGFAPNATVTVKGNKASRAQVNTLNVLLTLTERILDTNGVKAFDRRHLIMVTAVAVITQESDAGSDVGKDPNAVGDFQQDPHFWPATGNLVVDGTAFIDQCIAKTLDDPNLTPGRLGDTVQNPRTKGLYDKWVPEATNTVDQWLGNDGITMPATAAIPTDAPDPTRGQFMRGKLEDPTTAYRKHRDGIAIAKRTVLTADAAGQLQGNKLVVREDNWACFTRICAEIGWRGFCVSGTVYMIDDFTLFHQKVAMTLSEQDDGVDTLDPDFTQGKAKATIKTKARINRWQAAPGSVVAVQDLGPQASGRWLVGTVERSLFDPDGDITLQKPSASIPESAAPEHGAGQASGVYVAPSGGAQVGQAGAGVGGDSQRIQVAQQLMKKYGVAWFDDNGRGLAQIRKVARGQQLTNEAGQQVDLDVRTMQVVLALIDQGYQIGTFAWCEDHFVDGTRGHAGGRAVDISSINRIPINSPLAHDRTLAVARLINGATGDLAPRQEICGGSGNVYQPDIAAYCIPNAATFDYVDSSGRNVLRQEHTNHIHVGY